MFEDGYCLIFSLYCHFNLKIFTNLTFKLGWKIFKLKGANFMMLISPILFLKNVKTFLQIIRKKYINLILTVRAIM